MRAVNGKKKKVNYMKSAKSSGNKKASYTAVVSIAFHSYLHTRITAKIIRSIYTISTVLLR